MVALILLLAVARQIKLIRYSSKKDSVKFEIKSQITLQVVQSCSQDVTKIETPAQRSYVT